MPTITNADALLHAAKDMTTALEGGIAQTLQTKEAVKQLMQIFHENAAKAKAKEDAKRPQRVRRSEAQAQRVIADKAEATAPQTTPGDTEQANEQSTQRVGTPAPATPKEPQHGASAPNIISQSDDDDSVITTPIHGPAANTRSKARVQTLSDQTEIELETAMVVIEAAQPGPPRPTLQQALL